MSFKKFTPKALKKVYHWIRFYIEKIYFSIFYNVKCFKKTPNPNYYSQYGQDYYLDKFIIPSLKHFNGTIVEIGCNDPVYNNNTFFFQNKHKVISIDPINYSQEYKHRKNTTFVNCAIANQKGVSKYYKVRKKEGWEDQMSSFLKPEAHFEYNIIEVPTNTLNNILDEYDINKISILFLDVEGHEFNILSTFDFIKYDVDLVVVENKIFGNKIRKLLKQNGYLFKYRFWTADDVFVRKQKLSAIELKETTLKQGC